MTGEQRATCDQLASRGYPVRVQRTGRGGVLIARVNCKLTDGTLPLRIYPNGFYMPPWYDPNTKRTQEVAA